MSSQNIIELEARSVVYYSQHDEKCFFDWLDRMGCVKGYAGKGETLFIAVDRDRVTSAELLDLLGFFYRYGISMSQLQVFDLPQFSDWFPKRGTYWHYRVFRAKR
jgi:hypothetical protein